MQDNSHPWTELSDGTAVRVYYHLETGDMEGHPFKMEFRRPMREIEKGDGGTFAERTLGEIQPTPPLGFILYHRSNTTFWNFCTPVAGVYVRDRLAQLLATHDPVGSSIEVRKTRTLQNVWQANRDGSKDHFIKVETTGEVKRGVPWIQNLIGSIWITVTRPRHDEFDKDGLKYAEDGPLLTSFVVDGYLVTRVAGFSSWAARALQTLLTAYFDEQERRSRTPSHESP